MSEGAFLIYWLLLLLLLLLLPLLLLGVPLFLSDSLE
jgi:hypothetical protein